MNKKLPIFQKVLLTFFLSLTLGLSVKAQMSTLTIGEGDGTSNLSPIYTYYGYNYSQTIVLGEEIAAAGGEGGMISAIRFYHVSGTAVNATSWNVYLGNTNQSSFSGVADWIDGSELTQVFSGSITYPGDNEWLEIQFDEPFPYTGENLVVAVDENTPGWNSPAVMWGVNSSSEIRTIYFYNDNINPDPMSPPTTGFSLGSLNSYSYLQLELTPFEECAGIPSPGMAYASGDSICAGGEVLNFSLENPLYTFSGINYQWQINTGDEWTDIEDGDSYNLSYDVTESAAFRAILVCDAEEEVGYSDSIFVFVNPLPDVTVTPESYAICTDGSVILTATGAESYSWAPEDGLSTTTGTTVEASPEDVQLYTVTGTSAAGCVNSASASVSPITLLTVVAESSVSGLCEPGELVTISVGELEGGGNWSYQWTDTAGTVIQDWAPISNLAVTPEENGNYMYQLNVVSSLCNEDTVTTSLVNVVVGFGAEVDSIDINCNTPEGSFILSNVYGQKSDTLRYGNDFTDPIDPADNFTDVSGNAHVESGRMVLTNSQTSVNGQFTIYNQGFNNYSVTDFEVSFDLTADMPINTYGTGGGDGLAYSFGDDVENVGVGNNANGSGSKLRLSFDAADNGTNGAGIYLTYGYAGTGPIPVTDANVVAYSDNMSWKFTTDTPVNLYITADGRATLTVGGNVVFNQVQMPDAFVEANKSIWYHRFSAHTGGDALRHAIDNLQIRFHQLQFGITSASSTNAPSNWQGSLVFDELSEGSYNLWMSNLDLSCSEIIGTFTIDDLNPTVIFDTPVNLCEGEEITFDAGNVGASYMWSDGSEEQTLTVSEAGNYWVLVTDTADCFTIESVTVNEGEPSSFEGILVTYEGDEVILAVENPVNANMYFWDFGDGETAETSIPSVSHTYADNGTYTVTLTASGTFSCEEMSMEQEVNVTVGIEELNAAEAGFKIYPNPAIDQLVIANEHNVPVQMIRIFDATGKLVTSEAAIPYGNNQFDITALNSGFYFIRISTTEATYNLRFMVSK